MKSAFTSKFPGARYLVAGLNDPVDLPTDGKIAALYVFLDPPPP